MGNSLRENWAWSFFSSEIVWQIPVNVSLEYIYIYIYFSKGGRFRVTKKQEGQISLSYKVK